MTRLVKLVQSCGDTQEDEIRNQRVNSIELEKKLNIAIQKIESLVSAQLVI
jgi:hypothetical protein